MSLHMMMRHTGLPGPGDWPEGTRYNSSVEFDIDLPAGRDELVRWTCRAEFANGTLPAGFEGCGRADVEGEGEAERVAEADWKGNGNGEREEEGVERVQFRMARYTALGNRRAELSFVLEVFRVVRAG